MTRSTYTVTGMSCEHCAGAVRGEVGQLAGVTAVAVDVTSGHLTVVSTAPLDADAVRTAVEEAGYELAG